MQLQKKKNKKKITLSTRSIFRGTLIEHFPRSYHANTKIKNFQKTCNLQMKCECMIRKVCNTFMKAPVQVIGTGHKFISEKYNSLVKRAMLCCSSKKGFISYNQSLMTIYDTLAFAVRGTFYKEKGCKPMLCRLTLKTL